jgi:nitrogen fixation-related uncharacterized protein
MADMNDEKQYEAVIKILKGLPSVNASADFEMNLKRRINSEKYSGKKHEKTDWLIRLLQPSKLIPSAALAAAAVFMLFFFNIESPQFDDPLSSMPKVREDVLTGSTAEKVVLDRVSRANPQGIQSAANVNNIMKSGLNFRQINLSEEDKIKLQEMKSKFKQWLSKGE